jgi:hypothetical protein
MYHKFTVIPEEHAAARKEQAWGVMAGRVVMM